MCTVRFRFLQVRGTNCTNVIPTLVFNSEQQPAVGPSHCALDPFAALREKNRLT